jgi:hypothetical protein
VRVAAARVDRGTWHVMARLPCLMRIVGFGLRTPKAPNPGRSVAGIVESVGIPVSGLTALQAVRDHGNVQAGQKVLIVGASGGVGSFAIQIAKAFWTSEATVGCHSCVELSAHKAGSSSSGAKPMDAGSAGLTASSGRICCPTRHPEAGHVHLVREFRGPDGPLGSRRVRTDCSGHRPERSVERSPGGHPIFNRRSRPRQGRHHRLRRKPGEPEGPLPEGRESECRNRRRAEGDWLGRSASVDYRARFQGFPPTPRSWTLTAPKRYWKMDEFGQRFTLYI